MARRVTIVDVAARAGVAISSASAALNGRSGVSERTRDRVREAAAELGYVPSLRAKSLSAKRAFAVGLVVQRDVDVLEADPFFGAFIGGIEEVLSAQGYALVLQVTSDAGQTLERYRELATNSRVDGVFLNELQVDDPRIELLTELGLPAVAINSAPAGAAGFPSARQDGAQAVRDTVDLLAGLGHRDIAHVSGPEQFLHSWQRRHAWREAVEARGLVPGGLVVGDFTYESGRRAADELLGGPDRPTAVVCANDLMAVGLVMRAEELGLRVPEDVSVTGFDGIALGTYVRPRLTTVQTSPRVLARSAAALLLQHIAGESVADVEIAPAALVVRESTAAAPGV